MALGKAMPENIEKGCRQLPYAEWGGRTAVRGEIGEGQDLGPSSNPSGCIGWVEARLAGRLCQYEELQRNQEYRTTHVSWDIVR